MDPQDLFEANRQRLCELAGRAAARGLDGTQIAIVCIQVDSDWRDLVDHFMPGVDWQKVRARGEEPIARGSVMRDGLVEMLGIAAPDLRKSLAAGPPRGEVHVIVLTTGKATLYSVVPIVEAS